MGALGNEKLEKAELVSLACRILGTLDVTHAALGHVSYRERGADSILIKGKGPNEVGVRYTSSDDILEVDFNAEKIAGPDGLQPPSETYIHIWMYKKNPDLRSVIHMHPEHAVLLTICNKEILPIIGAYGQGARLAVEGVPTYPRSLTITNDESGQEFANFMGEKKVAMMHGHGITVVGSSIEDATVRTLAFDQLTTMMYKAYLLGEPRKISEEDIASLNQPPETNRRRGSAGGHAGMLATWRYYKTLAGEGESP